MRVHVRKPSRVPMEKVRACYYACKKCGRQISSEEYYLYGVCDICRW